MQSYQRAIETLLLATGADRAMLHIHLPDDGFAIVAEAVQHGALHLHDVDPQPQPDEIDGESADIVEGDEIVGIITVQLGTADRDWSPADDAALQAATETIHRLLEEDAARGTVAGAVDLQMAGAHAILEALRDVLEVQRCTYRRPVLDGFAFPVVLESRDEEVNSLLGDFTVVQTGQPVIDLLLSTRAQVVQPDCRTASDEPKFQAMLDHYGGLSAQFVTPYIVGETLQGVLSVHELSGPRDWTDAELALGAAATRLIGGLFDQDVG